LVLVPAEPRKEQFDLLDISALRSKGSFRTANWLANVEEWWARHRSAKDEKNFPSVLDRIDYQKLLTRQNPSKRYILLYVASGTYVIAGVVDRNIIPDFRVDDAIIKPREFVAESKTWFYESDTEDEVHYLCSVLNSKILSEHVKNLQTRGLWGARDIHRRPLLFNIPHYQPANENHRRLAEISRELHMMVPKLDRTGKKRGISSRRRRIQKIFYKELEEVDAFVAGMLNLRKVT